MLHLWLTRRWLLATLAAVAFATGCWFAGQWQWGRHVEQQAKVTAIATNYDSAAVPLASVTTSPLPPERQWTKVSLSGTYAVGADVMVRNRTLDDIVGFEVLTPFTTGRRTLLVDRGWVPNARNAETAPPADPPPSGTVEVVGWLRTGEPSLGRNLPPPQLSSVSIDEARALQPSVDTDDVYVVLGSQQPTAQPGTAPVRLLPRPEEDLGPHQAYAYQWWLFMPGGLAFVFFAVRHEVRRTREEDVERSDPGLERVPARPKKVRIWDEEDA